MKRIVILASLLATGAAQAIAPATSPTTSVASAQAPAAKRFPGVSDAGNAVLAKSQSAPDPQFQAIGKQQRAAHDQVMSAVMAPVIDVDKVTAALRQEEAVQSQVRAHNTDRLIAVLKQLPEEDRGTFLRTLMMSRQQRPAGAPTPTPTPTPQP